MAIEVRTRAVTAKAIKYGESDLIITFVTETDGVVKAIAKGAARSMKRFQGCFEPFTEIDAALRPSGGDGLWRMVSADVIDQRRGIGEDLERIRAGAVMLELASRIPALPNDYAEAYGLLSSALDQLASAADPAALLAGYWVRHMDVTGNPIVLTVCKDCGGDIGDIVCYTGGEGCVCTVCSHGEANELKRGLVGFIGHVHSTGPGMLGRLRLSVQLRDEVLGFLTSCTRALTDVNPVTLKAVSG